MPLVITDQFSSLSRDEVSVLFYFLWSDSGPDFTDTDLLFTLNDIRQWMYDKVSVTSGKAQRTLDRLKSRGFLWDQDGHLTEDAKDETMYRFTEPAYHDTGRGGTVILRQWWLYPLSSVSTAVRYLRSQGYTRKSGEKCVISKNPAYDIKLIQRLQMDILIHVTMEDTGIYDKVSQYCMLILFTVIYSNVQQWQRYLS
jgi:hypothetical protein